MRRFDFGPAQWLLALHLFAAVAATAIGGHYLEYDRAAVGAGEGWRLFTAAYVHTNAVHLTMNLVALILLWALMPERWRLWALSALPFLGAIVFSVDHYWLGHRWACGLSGPLHALAAGFLAARANWLAFAVGAGAVAKAVFEVTAGLSATPDGLIGAAVLTDHHLTGAALGLCASLFVWGLRYTRLRSTRPAPT